METINSKFLDKYQTLKKRKFSELKERTAGEKDSLEKYHRGFEELVEALNTENYDLQEKLSLMEDDYEKQLMKEKEKVKDLTDENARLRDENAKLRDFLLARKNNSMEHGTCRNDEQNGSRSLHIISNGNISQEKNICTNDENNESPSLHRIPERSVRSPSDNPTHIERSRDLDHRQNKVVTVHGRSYADTSEDGSERHSSKCILQTLVEVVAGVKLSVHNEKDLPHISVVHPSSGYSFSLTWLRNATDEDGFWIYNVSSLGTLEVVALEWMREEIKFSSAMCSIFCEKISRVMGRY